MYVQNKGLEPPEEVQQIWRYMDLAKFLSLREDQALYFSCVAKFDDPYEGLFPLSLWKSFADIREDKKLNRSKDIDDIIPKLREIERSIRHAHYVNCWHMNTYESAAMWEIYQRSGEGIAVTGRLKVVHLWAPQRRPVHVSVYPPLWGRFCPLLLSRRTDAQLQQPKTPMGAWPTLSRNDPPSCQPPWDYGRPSSEWLLLPFPESALKGLLAPPFDGPDYAGGNSCP